MKFITAIVCFVLIIALVRTDVISQAHINECKQKFSSATEDPNEYDSCVYKKAGIQEEDGSINFSKLKQAVIERYQKLNLPLDVAALGSAIERCKDVRGTNDADTVGKLHSCIDETLSSQ